MQRETNNNPLDKQFSWQNFPWWFLGVMVVLLYLIFLTIFDPRLYEIFLFLIPGIPRTIWISSLAWILAVAIGTPLILVTRSRFVFFRHIGLFYMAIIGSIPLLFLILVFAFVLIPTINLTSTIEIRFVLALAIAYSVFWTEKYLIELGNYTNPPNAREQKKGAFDIFWPVPFKRILLLLGVMLVGILKDSAWMSILAIKDVAQLSRLHAGSTFQFAETYLVAILLYLLLTIPFNSVLVYYYQQTVERL
jgi:polar amino acid transport system permease protein